MKKLAILILALLVLAPSVLSGMAEEAIRVETEDIGVLSMLNLTEEEYAAMDYGRGLAIAYLQDNKTFAFANKRVSIGRTVYYDTLDAMVMGLLAGDIYLMNVPGCTADYLCATNDALASGLPFTDEAAEDAFSRSLIQKLGFGYSFLMREADTALRDTFDGAISAMKADGTLDKLVEKYIHEACRTGAVEAVPFDKNDGETIRVAVTGCLPPLDYVAPDGGFAGFNTAILAEIGRRTGMNIELLQVDSVGRAAALASGVADAVFWARGPVEDDPTNGMTDEEFAAYIEEQKRDLDENQVFILDAILDAVSRQKRLTQDIPEGTIITQPYYSDINSSVMRRDLHIQAYGDG